MAGRILVRTENGVKSVLVHPDRALACIPNLCIHFDHEVNKGKNYNPQVDLQPIFGAAGTTLRQVLAEEAGVRAEDILDSDLMLCTCEQAVRVGLKGEYFMSGRIDDLECAYTTLWGFLQGRGEEEGRGDIWVMFDNEEVGSSSRQARRYPHGRRAGPHRGEHGRQQGAEHPRPHQLSGAERRQRPRHPSQPPRKERPGPSGHAGRRHPAEIHARQTYTTSGLTGAAFSAICQKAGVPVQFASNRADVPGGSTLGNLLGHQILIPMVDIGLAQLAMHSSMETASCIDAEYMAKAVAEFYNTPISQPKDGEWKLGL